MTTDRWRDTERLFLEALEKTAEERESFLTDACGEDEGLRRQVERLLDADSSAGERLEEAVAGGFDLLRRNERATEPGRSIGPYRILRTLGEGGMGEVLLATRDDQDFERHVAIKIVRTGMATRTVVDRFRRERQILADLEHPNIAGLLDGGSTDTGLPYLVMEHIEGLPLDEYCDLNRHGVRTRISLVLSVCQAVSHAHQRLVVHRDLKPSNILVTADGTVKLLDFGIAKLLVPDDSTLQDITRTEQPRTLSYASPEQIRGELVTAASDVYSLGVLLYKLLTGHLPFEGGEGDSRHAVERRILETRPLPPSASLTELDDDTAESTARLRNARMVSLKRRLAGDLDNIVLKALAKDPERRYSSVDRFALDLENHLAGRPVTARPATLAYTATKYLRRNWLQAGLAASVIGILSALAVGYSLELAAATNDRDTNRSALQYYTDFITKSADGGRSLNEDLTAREMLGLGLSNLDARFGNQPKIKAKILDLIGVSYYNLGLYAEARPVLEQALELRRRHFPETSIEMAESLNHLADLEAAESSYELAEQLYRESIAAAEDVDEAENLVADGYNDLALIFRYQGRVDEAEPLFRRALELYRRIVGPNASQVATALNNLGLVAMDRGDLEESEALFRQALSIDRERYGDQHVEVAQDLNNLGVNLQYQGDYERSKEVHLEALEIRRDKLDPGHPAVQESMNNLGVVHYRLGEYRAAEPIFTESLELTLRQLGPEHPETALRLANLGAMRGRLGFAKEYEDLTRRAYEVRREVLGEDHMDTLMSLHHVARGLEQQARYQEAEKLTLDIIRRSEDRPEPLRVQLVRSAMLLSRVRLAEGAFEEAVTTAREALEITRDASGLEHPRTIRALSHLGWVETLAGDLGSARTRLDEALENQRATLNPGHPDLALTLSRQGELLLALGEEERAEAVLREALEIQLQAFGEDHWRVAVTDSLLGRSLVALGNTGEGRSRLESSIRLLDEKAGPASFFTRQARQRLAAPQMGAAS